MAQNKTNKNNQKCKINRTLFHFNEDIYICHIYIPPISCKVLFDKDFDFFFEEIEKGIEKHSIFSNSSLLYQMYLNIALTITFYVLYTHYFIASVG